MTAAARPLHILKGGRAGYSRAVVPVQRDKMGNRNVYRKAKAIHPQSLAVAKICHQDKHISKCERQSVKRQPTTPTVYQMASISITSGQFAALSVKNWQYLSAIGAASKSRQQTRLAANMISRNNRGNMQGMLNIYSRQRFALTRIASIAKMRKTSMIYQTKISPFEQQRASWANIHELYIYRTQIQQSTSVHVLHIQIQDLVRFSSLS
ncbi:hypothetical protein FGO68_gene2147 [Halteria grandinella]|uniref:Uncharacterized protein n=1 Tax=Halteria grandinella TaxID=5974 RepID=A0A8J8NIL9_HALGN|nr:hypothetical protein FGO68_gene2147 [Halteria grandinella]